MAEKYHKDPKAEVAEPEDAKIRKEKAVKIKKEVTRNNCQILH